MTKRIVIECRDVDCVDSARYVSYCVDRETNGLGAVTYPYHFTSGTVVTKRRKRNADAADSFVVWREESK